MKRRLIAVLSLMLSLMLILTACGEKEPAQTDGSNDSSEYPELNFTICTPGAADSGKSYDIRLFIDKVTAASGGKITFSEYFNASLCAATADLETISGGLADCGTVVNLYTPSQLPLSQVSYPQPFGPTDPQMVSDIMTKLSEKHPELYEEYEKNNCKVLAYKGNESYNVLAVGNIGSLSDLSGHKLGIGGVYNIPWFESISVACVSSPATDSYQNMKNNVFDGVFAYDSLICDYKYYEVTNTLFQCDMGTRNNDVLCFNLDTWNSLDANVQELLQKCADEAYTEFHQWEVQQATAWRQEIVDAGINVVEISEADRTQWAETALAYNDTLQSWIDAADAAGYDGASIMADYLTIAQDLGWTWSFDITPYVG